MKYEPNKSFIGRKIDDLKHEVEVVKYKASMFWKRNKEDIIRLAPYVVAIGIPTVNAVRKYVITAKQESLMTRHIYDRSAGHYWILRKKPTQAQWSIIDQRKAQGESLYVILSDMNLLK